MVNGLKSGLLPVSLGIPQGSVRGLTLFTLFTNDLPPFGSSRSLYMYADNTTVYCTGETADKAITHLNAALQELHAWCLNNRLTPHPGKSEVMLLSKGTLMGQIALVLLGTLRKHACWA